MEVEKAIGVVPCPDNEERCDYSASLSVFEKGRYEIVSLAVVAHAR